MKELLRQLLDLDTLGLDMDGVRFGFENPLASWVWGLGVLAGVALAVWSYSRLVGNRFARYALSCVRASILLLLLFLVAGPQLVRRTESIERDWVLVLVDRSSSLTIEDTQVTTSPDRVSRESALRESLEQTWPLWRELSQDRSVVWLGFDAGAFDLDSVGDASDRTVDLGDPDGERTALGAALDQALARAAARPVSAVVVLTDGRSADTVSRTALRRLQSERIPVHSVALGSAEPIGDISVRRIDAPSVAFVNDVTPVRVDLERLSTSGNAGATVRLVDRSTGIVLDEQRAEFDPDDPSMETGVTLASRPDGAGRRTWFVEVIPDGPDLIAGNNGREIGIDLVDRPLRALYIDGYPRWEQRYLRNMLLRERSITSSSLILAPDRRYTQEGNIEIDAMPDSLEQWAEYDVIMLGDVAPEVFTVEQLAQLREHISLRGAGLIWIAGEGATPHRWWGTPLSDLLPFVREATDGTGIGEPQLVRPTDDARRLGVLRLDESADSDWPEELSDPSTGWSALWWTQRIDSSRLKPTTQILATGTGVYSGEVSPIVLSMRYGAGRSLFVATDEIWRWRYARGEKLPERFWIQMIRMLGRESLSRSGVAAILEAAPRRGVIDQPVRISVELLDQSLLEIELPSIGVRIENVRSDAGSSRVSELTLRRNEISQRVYSGTWIPPDAGAWRLDVSEPLLAAHDLGLIVEVAPPDDELRHPETDHESLRVLGESTGGSIISVDGLGPLLLDPEQLPKRRVVTYNETSESLWDTPLALVLLVFFLTLEWIGRRVIRLI